MARNWKHRRDDAGSMLAAVVVIVLGVVICGFISAAADSASSGWMMGLAVAVAALMVGWIVWYRYFRDTSGGLAFWHALGRNHREDGLASQYRPRKVKDGRSDSPTGTNKPITAEEAHELQVSSTNTWVPSKNREGGKP